MGYLRYFPLGLKEKREQLLAAWDQPWVQKKKHRKDAIVCVGMCEDVVTVEAGVCVVFWH